MTNPKPSRPRWFGYIATALLLATLVLLVVSLGISTYRLIVPVPRPAAPTYVCVYISTKDITSVSGSSACTEGVSR